NGGGLAPGWRRVDGRQFDGENRVGDAGSRANQRRLREFQRRRYGRSRGNGRTKLLMHRTRAANDDDAAAHRAARANTDARDLVRVHAKHGTAFRTGYVHSASPSPPPSPSVGVADRVVDAASRSPAAPPPVGASVRRSIENTEPGNVLA